MSKRMAKVCICVFCLLWFGFFLTSCFFFFIVVFLRIDPHPPGQSWPGLTQWASFPIAFELSQGPGEHLPGHHEL